MASTPVAPAPAAPSTPVSTPASTPTSTPVAPVSAPETVQTPTPAVETPSTPVVAPKAPNKSDYANDQEGQQKFLDDLHKYERDNPESDVPDYTAEPEKPVEEPEKPEVELPATEEEAEWAPPPVNATPEVVSEWLKNDPALNAALEANPTVKNQLYAMARMNAKAKPLLEMFPNEQAGRFAVETSSRMVDLRDAFTGAVATPDSIGGAYEKLAEEFMVRDDKGAPVLDAEGNPTFYPDFNMMNHHIVDSYLEDALQSAKAQFEQTKAEDDETYVNVLEYLKQRKNSDGKPAAPKMDNITPEQKAWFDQRSKELEEREKKLGLDTQVGKLETTVAQRQQFEQQVLTKQAGSAGKFIGDYIDQKRNSGVLVPSLVLEMAGSDGIPIILKQVYDDLNKKIASVPYYQDHLKGLQRQKPSAQAEGDRLLWFNERCAEFLPDLIDNRLREAQKIHKADQARRTAARKPQVVEREPSGGTAPVGTQVRSDQAIMSEARAWVDKNQPGLERSKREEAALNKFKEITRGR